MAITVYARGSGTLAKSAPGAQASSGVYVSGCAASYAVSITPTSALPLDGSGMHTIYGYTATDYVYVKSSRKELPSNVTFDYVVFSGTA